VALARSPQEPQLRPPRSHRDLPRRLLLLLAAPQRDLLISPRSRKVAAVAMVR
jgi:hypothetical protein